MFKSKMHNDDKKKLEAGFELFSKAVKVSAKKPTPRKLIREVIK